MSVKLRLALACISLMLLSGSIAALDQKEKSGTTSSTNRGTNVSTGVAVDIFVGKDRDAIRHYYALHPGNLPPGLAKRGGDLPPGLEKQLRRKGHLPPGLDKRIAALPVELERQLAPLKPGLVRGVIEGRAVIYNPKTSLVLDVLVIL